MPSDLVNQSWPDLLRPDWRPADTVVLVEHPGQVLGLLLGNLGRTRQWFLLIDGTVA